MITINYNMKYLKTFESYNNSNFTIDFIDGKISESDYIKFLSNDFINESITGNITDFIQKKVIDSLNSFLHKAAEIGFKVIEKLKTFFNWIVNTIKSFKQKHPVLFKLIVITLIIMIILIVTTATASAQAAGTQPSVNTINEAIGLLENLHKSGKIDDNSIYMKAVAHLIDMRDGKIDIQNLGSEAIKLSDIAVKTIINMNKEAKTAYAAGDNSIIDHCIQLMDQGAKFVSASYDKSMSISGGYENIKLGIK